MHAAPGVSDMWKRIFQYTDSLGWFLNVVSLLASIGAGATLPLMTIIFGSAIGEFSSFQGGGSTASGFDDNVVYYVYAKRPLTSKNAYAEAENGLSICSYHGLFWST